MIATDPLKAFPAGQRPALADAGLPAGVALRALHREDLPWLAQLFASTREDELAPLGWPEAMLHAFLQQQFSAQHQHYLASFPNAHYLAVEAEGECIGRLYVDEHGEDDLIVDISLLPSWRGRGLGRALIQAQQRTAAQRGRGVALHVLLGNVAAQRLYQRLGFVAQGDTSLHRAMRWPAAGLS